MGNERLRNRDTQQGTRKAFTQSNYSINVLLDCTNVLNNNKGPIVLLMRAQ